MKCKEITMKNKKCQRQGLYNGYCGTHLNLIESGQKRVSDGIKELIDRGVFVMEKENEQKEVENGKSDVL